MIDYSLNWNSITPNLNYCYTAVDICQKFIYWNEKISLPRENEHLEIFSSLELHFDGSSD